MSAAVYLSYSVLWVITQRRFVKHRRFGTTYRSGVQEEGRVAKVRYCIGKEVGGDGQ